MELRGLRPVGRPCGPGRNWQGNRQGEFYWLGCLGVNVLYVFLYVYQYLGVYAGLLSIGHVWVVMEPTQHLCVGSKV